MANNSILILIGLIIIIGAGGLVYWQKNAAFDEVSPSDNSNDGVVSDSSTMSDDDEGEIEDEDDDVTPSPTGNTTSGTSFTMTQVATHNSAQSCWSAINGNVYDLTSWIPNHPGGPDKILQLCGTDGSAKFNGQHGGSPQQATVLAGFKIGVLDN